MTGFREKGEVRESFLNLLLKFLQLKITSSVRAAYIYIDGGMAYPQPLHH